MQRGGGEWKEATVRNLVQGVGEGVVGVYGQPAAILLPQGNGKAVVIGDGAALEGDDTTVIRVWRTNNAGYVRENLAGGDSIPPAITVNEMNGMIACARGS